MSARARKRTKKKKAAKKPVRKKTTSKKAAGKKAKKKVTKKKAVKKKTAKKKAVKKKVVKKKTTKKKIAKKKPAKKATNKKTAKKVAQKVAKPVKKQPLTAEEKRARAQKRAAERKFLKESKARLLARREALVEAYHSAKGNTKASTAGGTEDYIDYAVSSYERDFSLSLTELERKNLLLVEEALARVRRGEYGRCLNCGVVIPPRRLEVEAWARYCIPCQELDDQGLLEDPVFETEPDEEPAAGGDAGNKSPADDADQEDEGDEEEDDTP